jgi:MoaA/NifB/PqqE/SkfB family radical SAM enzyme
MALVKSNYIKYDMTLEEYYINIDCVTNYTNYTSDELNAVGINNKALKAISHNVYRLIYDYRKGIKKHVHKKFMRLKIYNNEDGEVTALLLAMVEAVKGAVESGMDLNAYINEPKDNLPYTVKEELKGADLLDASEKIDYGLDITYTDADELIVV